jgi:hypothetical protein
MNFTRANRPGWLVPALLLLLAGCGPSVAPEVYLVPAQYEGVLLVQYGQMGYPALPRSGDSLVFDFRPGRLLRTSSPLVTGAAATAAFQYYYVDASGHRTRIRKVEDRAALRQRPATEPCLVVNAGQVSQNLVCKFLTSAQNFERNDSLSTWLFDSLLAKDTVSAELQ